MSISTEITNMLQSGKNIELDKLDYYGRDKAILDSRSPSNIFKNSNTALKNNFSVRRPIKAAPWHQYQFHQYLWKGMIIMTVRVTATERNHMYNVASIGQINWMLRKAFETYMGDKNEIKQYINKTILDENDNVISSVPLCEKDYMDENVPNTLGNYLSKKSEKHYTFLSSKSIWNTIKSVALINAVSGDIETYIGAATKRTKINASNQLATIVSGVGFGCANYWRGCQDHDYVGFILKRHQVKNSYAFQFVPWHGKNKQPRMKEMQYIDLNGYDAFGYFLPFGRIMYIEENLSRGAMVEELCFGSPEDGFNCFSSRK